MLLLVPVVLHLCQAFIVVLTPDPFCRCVCVAQTSDRCAGFCWEASVNVERFDESLMATALIQARPSVV